MLCGLVDFAAWRQIVGPLQVALLWSVAPMVESGSRDCVTVYRLEVLVVLVYGMVIHPLDREVQVVPGPSS